MSESVVVDPEALREQVRQKYREVATNPAGTFHFHTGRFLAAHLGYNGAVLATLPDAAVEGSSVPHWTQLVAIRVPHSTQNFELGAFSYWQRGHFISPRNSGDLW